MDSLGLTRKGLDAYEAYLCSPHDFDVHVDILDMEENHAGQLDEEFLDGQVNFQRDGLVKRTGSFSFRDPDHSMHLDSDSPFAGAVFADRMIRVRHVVEVPGYGRVRATVFIGPCVTVSRDGDVLTIECQDKTLLAIEGCEPYTVKKGRNAVDAIRSIMEDCTGERRFRFPADHKARLTRSYTVGWKTEASPWRVCLKIADALNMQLVYAADGALMLRHKPKHPVLSIRAGQALTAPPKTAYDLTKLRNIVRFKGFQNKKKNIHIADVARPKPQHKLSPRSLGRHGVPRYLPESIEDSSVKKTSVAHRRAKDALDKGLSQTATITGPSVPFFHLDYGDPVRFRTDWGTATVPLESASIPVGRGGDAELGSQKVVRKFFRRRKGGN